MKWKSEPDDNFYRCLPLQSLTGAARECCGLFSCFQESLTYQQCWLSQVWYRAKRNTASNWARSIFAGCSSSVWCGRSVRMNLPCSATWSMFVGNVGFVSKIGWKFLALKAPFHSVERLADVCVSCCHHSPKFVFYSLITFAKRCFEKKSRFSLFGSVIIVRLSHRCYSGTGRPRKAWGIYKSEKCRPCHSSG